jgi:myosin heavy subunit
MFAAQHFSNRKADTDPRPFKNDVNNVAALQSARLQKRRMEEAALLQQKLLNDTAEKLGKQVVDTRKVKQELEDIRKLKDILTQTVDHMSVELNKSKDDLARAMTANQETHDQMENWRRLKDGELASRNIEMENLRRQKDGELTSKNSELNNKNVELENKNVELEMKNRELNKLKDEKEQVRDLYNKLNDETNKLRKQLPFSDQQNCLPAQYHNSIVLIMNVRSTLAIDLGKGKIPRLLCTFSQRNEIKIFKTTGPKVTAGTIPLTMKTKFSTCGVPTILPDPKARGQSLAGMTVVSVASNDLGFTLEY